MQNNQNPFTLTSSAFQNQSSIPQIYTCDGKNISPPLQWKNIPSGSGSLALIMDDPDAPVGTWDHWILFNLPPDLSGLEENLSELPEGAKTSRNGFRKNEYAGPCPPGNSSHHYYFKLYALDTLLDLPEGAKKSVVEQAMQDHILGYTELVGIYYP
jgi:hypothetical protein